jgi:heme/copper-type cytochrome/quinol oxidase subunit 1
MRFRLPSPFRTSKTVRLHSFAFAFLAAAGLLITALLQVQTVDVPYRNTHLVVTLGHLVMAGGTLFGLFAVAWTVFQALVRHGLHERLGQAHFWLTLAGVLLSLAAVSIFSAGTDAGVGRAYAAMAALLFTLGVQLVFPVALALSWFRRDPA